MISEFSCPIHIAMAITRQATPSFAGSRASRLSRQSGSRVAEHVGRHVLQTLFCNLHTAVDHLGCRLVANVVSSNFRTVRGRLVTVH